MSKLGWFYNTIILILRYFSLKFLSNFRKILHLKVWKETNNLTYEFILTMPFCRCLLFDIRVYYFVWLCARHAIRHVMQPLLGATERRPKKWLTDFCAPIFCLPKRWLYQFINFVSGVTHNQFSKMFLKNDNFKKLASF